MKKLRIGIILFIFCLALFTTSCKKNYTVSFYDGDTLLKEEVVSANGSATAPDTTKEGYDFIFWDRSFDNVTSDLKVSAIYQIKTFTVNFYDINNQLITSEIVEYNKAAEGISGFDIESHNFLSWDKDFSKVTSDLDVYPVYELKKYSVKLLDINKEVVKSVTINHGEVLDLDDLEDTSSHHFVGWAYNGSPVLKDLTISSIYELNTYSVKYYDEDGVTLLHEETVSHGSDAVGFKPDRKGNLSFVKWDKSLKNITSNLDVIAEFGIVSHGITFYDGSDKLDLGVNSYNEGEITVLPKYEKDGYYFLGWYLSDISHTNYQVLDGNNTTNLLLYARFLPLKNYNQITLSDTPYHFTNVVKTTTYQCPLPSNVPSGVTNYTWTTSDPSVATVSVWSSITIMSSGYCVLTATNNSDPSIVVNCVLKVTSDGIIISSVEEANEYVLCNVTFKDKDGNIISETKCAKGGSVVYPIPTLYKDYKFVGWDKDNYNITSDCVINALYDKGVNNYTGKSFAIIGDSISTYKTHIPDGFSFFYANPVADVTDVNKTWWMQVINKVGGSLFVNNSYSGSCVADAGSSSAVHESRLEYTTINGVCPDVILIYMGSNDCHSEYISLNDFDEDYKLMVERLQKLCPESEIILCTLATSPFYPVNQQTSYNDIIKKYADQFDLKLIDLSVVNLEGHLCDSAHPNTSGMTVIADEIVRKLLEE